MNHSLAKTLRTDERRTDVFSFGISLVVVLSYSLDSLDDVIEVEVIRSDVIHSVVRKWRSMITIEEESGIPLLL